MCMPAQKRVKKDGARSVPSAALDLWLPEVGLWRLGIAEVVGVDEVGVGPLAGPVVAAAVLLPRRLALAGLDDSKRLSPAHRERLAVAIRARAVAVGYGGMPAAAVDRLGIRAATAAAMQQALRHMWRRGVPYRPSYALVDGRPVAGLATPHTAMVGGDRRSASIAAASILAKVARDALMRTLDTHHPAYGFAAHKGYGTARHLAALVAHGPCRAHRHSFAPVAQAKP